MAKTTNRDRRRRSQAPAQRRGREILRETEQRLREQRRALEQQRKAAEREALKTKRALASLLRKLGLYKPKAKRITFATIKKSGALQRKIRFYKAIPTETIKREKPRPPVVSRTDRIDTTVDRIAKNTGIDDDRREELRALAREHSKVFFEIIRISHARHTAYKKGVNYEGPDWPDEWEIFEDFVELFYYNSLI